MSEETANNEKSSKHSPTRVSFSNAITTITPTSSSSSIISTIIKQPELEEAIYKLNSNPLQIQHVTDAYDLLIPLASSTEEMTVRNQIDVYRALLISCHLFFEMNSVKEKEVLETIQQTTKRCVWMLHAISHYMNKILCWKEEENKHWYELLPRSEYELLNQCFEGSDLLDDSIDFLREDRGEDIVPPHEEKERIPLDLNPQELEMEEIELLDIAFSSQPFSREEGYNPIWDEIHPQKNEKEVVVMEGWLFLNDATTQKKISLPALYQWKFVFSKR